MRFPAELKAEFLTAKIDTREQLPLDLTPMKVITGTMPTADYTIVGLENYVVGERKSAEDMLGCIGRERERFDREVQRMLAYPCRVLIVEAGWQFFERGEWRGNVTSAAAIGSLLGWIAHGLPIIMAYDHERAGRYMARFLFTAAKRRWRESRELMARCLEAMEAAK